MRRFTAPALHCERNEFGIVVGRSASIGKASRGKRRLLSVSESYPEQTLQIPKLAREHRNCHCAQQPRRLLCVKHDGLSSDVVILEM